MRIPIYLVILILVFAFSLSIVMSSLCIKKRLRLLGLLPPIIIGGASARLGFYFAIEGFNNGVDIVIYPATGWILIIGGVVISLLGVILTLITKRTEIDDKMMGNWVYAINSKTGKGEKVRLDSNGNLPEGYQ